MRNKVINTKNNLITLTLPEKIKHKKFKLIQKVNFFIFFINIYFEKFNHVMIKTGNLHLSMHNDT